jgi:membrane associated rhomboid family serine protease/tetratricopeptide (TPR) repeat protein
MADPATPDLPSPPIPGEPAIAPAAPPTVANPRIWVTPLLVALNVVGFAVEVALGCSPTDPTVPQLRAAGAEFGVSVVEGEWWRPITAMFLHSGVAHLVGNMIGLATVGLIAEPIFGAAFLLVLYLTSGLAGSLVSLSTHPMSIAVGASGAIFGVFGATLVSLARHKQMYVLRLPWWGRLYLVAFLGYNIYGGITTPEEHINVAAHAGGLVAGIFAGLLLGRDLAHPAEHLTGRIVASLGIAVALLAGGYLVEGRMVTDPTVHEYRGLVAAVACGTTSRDAKSAADREVAVEACSKAVALDPKSADLFVQRAGVYADLGKTDLAVADATAALVLDPDSKLALRVRLHANLVRRNVEGTEADCVLLLARVKEPGVLILDACTRMARALGDGAEERDRVDRWLAVTPTAPVPLFFRAQLNEKEGRFDESRRDFERVVAAAPDDATNLNALAWMDVMVGDFVGARTLADRAVSMVPDAGVFHGTRCFALAGLGEREPAHAECARAVALLPESFIYIGMLAFLDHRDEDAREAWRRASEDPSTASELAPWVARLPASG